MIYIKSLVAGIAAVVIATLLMGLYLYIAYKPTDNEAIAWDPISLAHRPSAWLIAAVIFIAGFLWEFRYSAK